MCWRDVLRLMQTAGQPGGKVLILRPRLFEVDAPGRHPPRPDATPPPSTTPAPLEAAQPSHPPARAVARCAWRPRRSARPTRGWRR